MELFLTYAPAFPEMLLAVAAMALLMIGAFSDDNAHTGTFIGWLAIAVMVVAGALVAMQPTGTQYLFEDAFVVDQFARFMKLLILGGTAVALLLSFDFLRAKGLMKFEYPVLMLLSAVGMMMMVSANDLIALYMGLELQSLALYVMAAMHRDNVRSSEAGLKYFVLGALSSGMLLYGASLIYGFTGSTSFPVIAAVADGLTQGSVESIGLIVGLVFSACRTGIQGFGGSIPHVDAGCLSRCAHTSDGILCRSPQDGRHGPPVAGPRRRLSPGSNRNGSRSSGSSPSPPCCSVRLRPSARTISSA